LRTLRLLLRLAPLPVLVASASAFDQSAEDARLPFGPPPQDVSYELAWHEQAVSSPSDASRAATEPLPSPSANGEPATGDFHLNGDGCPGDLLTHGLYVFYGYDSWRGIQDDGWGNNGLHTGANYGTRLGPISDSTGVGFQIG